jgi:4,5-DOPA dioxygenase extradiol
MSISKMPVLFIGHGSPLNIVSHNTYTQSLQMLSASLPKPEAILVVSAHWLTRGTYVNSAKKPEQIYDFYGFPHELYKIKYHPPGAPEIAKSITQDSRFKNIQLDAERGIDHAAWAVLLYLYPQANIPVLEMSLDMTLNEEDHYELGKKFAFLRRQRILIIGSGNIVHNLRQIEYMEDAQPYPWAVEFDNYVKDALLQKNTHHLFHFKKISPAGMLAVPTNDHYLPMLYAAALQEKGEQVTFFHESIQNGSVSMRSFIIQ